MSLRTLLLPYAIVIRIWYDIFTEKSQISRRWGPELSPALLGASTWKRQACLDKAARPPERFIYLTVSIWTRSMIKVSARLHFFLKLRLSSGAFDVSFFVLGQVRSGAQAAYDFAAYDFVSRTDNVCAASRPVGSAARSPGLTPAVASAGHANQAKERSSVLAVPAKT
eukprot:2035147-Rhodomonas_salina.2